MVLLPPSSGFIQQLLVMMVSFLLNDTLVESFVIPASSRICMGNYHDATMTKNTFYYLSSINMVRRDEDDQDDNSIIPNSERKSRSSNVTSQITPPKTETAKYEDIKLLQQQYEAMMITDSSINYPKDSTYNQDRITSEYLVETTCALPSELISILKRELLWSNNNDTKMIHVPTILTSTERKRRLIEIDLLQNLIYDDDETVNQLWSLWYSERDNDTTNNHMNTNATTLLYTATTYSNNPTTWPIAEQILRQLILQYGVYWVEPLNRLATLYYLQGKYQASIDLCRIILYIKPWHFGALSGMVGLYIQLNDIQQAKKYAEQRLPQLIINNDDDNDTTTSSTGSTRQQQQQQSNQRRMVWVKNAVTAAKEALEDAEQQLQLSFGETDYVVRSQTSYDVKSTKNVTILIPTLFDTNSTTTSWQ